MSFKIIKVVFSMINVLNSAAMMEELFDLWNQSVRRLLFLNMMYRFTLLVHLRGTPLTRSCWSKIRRQSFWEVDCQLNSEAFFKNNFRMSRQSFKKLCDMLKGIQKKDTNYRKAIPLEKRVAIALYALGSSAEYRTIANMFGIGKSTTGQILIEFCQEIWISLWPLYLNKFPMSEGQLKAYMNGFEVLGFPQVLGAIDACHIVIHPAAVDAVDYQNNKGWYSTVLLALVDARCRFMYINVGSPGRCNDSKIYERSSLRKHLLQCSLFKNTSRQISGVKVPVVMLGDSAFSLDEHMMKPYPFSINQSPKEKKFNYRLSKCRKVVENAFAHLKARFRRVGKGLDNHVKNANMVIKACCILHNYLNEENDGINEKWLMVQKAEDQHRQYPENTNNISANSNSRAEEIRRAFSCYFDTDEHDGDGEATLDLDTSLESEQ